VNVRKSAKTLTSRAATHADIPLLLRVMEAAISELQREFLDEAQIRASRAIMGLDTQLIDDETYYAVECDGQWRTNIAANLAGIRQILEVGGD